MKQLRASCVLAMVIMGPVAPTAGQWQAVVPGIDYREYAITMPDGSPNKLFVARMDRSNASCILDSCIGQGQLRSGRETVSGMAQRYEDTINYWGQTWGARSDVVVAINGDGFNLTTGIPTSGQIISGWTAKRFLDYSGGSGFCWKLDRSCFLGGNVRNGSVHDRQRIYFPDGSYVVPSNVNTAEDPGDAGELLVFTTHFADRTYTDNARTEIVVEMSRPILSFPNGSPDYVSGVVREIRTNQGNTPIEFDRVVISAEGSYAGVFLSRCTVGTELRFQFDIKDYGTSGQVPTGPSDWTEAYASIGCFAYVVKDGIVPSQDWAGNAGALIRNPRTAIAFNDQYVFFLVCDGRSASSAGMTYTELGSFCLNTLGATWATNQDGGGSSAIWVNGQIKNHPSDAGGERAVANGMMMVVVQPKVQSTRFVPGQAVRTSSITPVRLGPGTNHGMLTSVPAGSTGQVISHSLNGVLAKGSYWWKCQFAGASGWVDENALQNAEVPPVITAIAPTLGSIADVFGGAALNVMITFDRPVVVASWHLSLTCPRCGPQTPTAFAWDADARTATWTYADLKAATYTGTLSDAVRTPTGAALDGEIRDPSDPASLPSGDGVAGGSATFSFRVRNVYGDFDEDGDVDMSDFAGFQYCFNGPSQPYPSTGCDVADFDADGDVDLNDFSRFQACFNGPNAPPGC